MAPLKGMGRFFPGMLFLLGISVQFAAAGSMVKLLELDLKRWNKSQGGNADKFPVIALSFSPDGKRLAVTGGETRMEDWRLVGRLLIARIGEREESVKAFEAPPGGMSPDWSPAGDAIWADGLLGQPQK
jgi:hypothetical protein